MIFRSEDILMNKTAGHFVHEYNKVTYGIKVPGAGTNFLENKLEGHGKDQWKLSFVKVQQKPFLENVISKADYQCFKKQLIGNE